MRRRFAVAGGAVVAVAALATGTAAASTLLPARHRVTTAAPTARTASPTASPPETQADTLNRLTTALTRQLRTLTPHTTYTGVARWQEYPGLTFVVKQHSWYLTEAAAHGSGGTGGVTVQVIPGNIAFEIACDKPLYANSTATCTHRTVHNVRVTIITDTAANGEVTYLVWGDRPDDSNVVVESTNYRPDATTGVKNPPAPAPTSDEPALGVDQAVAVVTNPDLHP